MARNFDTGFIKLDKNIIVKSKNAKENEEKKLFKRDQKDVFQFEDQDIRTVRQKSTVFNLKVDVSESYRF